MRSQPNDGVFVVNLEVRGAVKRLGSIHDAIRPTSDGDSEWTGHSTHLRSDRRRFSNQVLRTQEIPERTPHVCLMGTQWIKQGAAMVDYAQAQPMHPALYVACWVALAVLTGLVVRLAFRLWK